jgi:hypothetical protein
LNLMLRCDRAGDGDKRLASRLPIALLATARAACALHGFISPLHLHCKSHRDPARSRLLAKQSLLVKVLGRSDSALALVP